MPHSCLTLCSPPAAYLQPSLTSHSASLMILIPNLILNLIPIPASLPLRSYCDGLRRIVMDCDGLRLARRTHADSNTPSH